MHDKMLEAYMKGNNLMINGGYYMDFLGCYRKKLVRKVIIDHFINDPNKNGEIGLQGFGFDLFDVYDGEDREG